MVTPQERAMLWATAFYVFFDALPKVTSFIERVEGCVNP